MSGRRIGVNLLWMIPGVVGGTEDYTVRLLDTLSARGDFELVLFVRPDFATHHPDLAAATETVVAPRSGRNRMIRVALENTWLPRAAQRHSVEVIHHPGGTIPWYSKSRTVLTVHDLQPLELPRNFAPLKRWYLAGALPRSVRAADKVTATSGYVARNLESRLGLDADAVAIVPAGPGTVGSRPTESRLAQVRASYGLGESYVIFPAITYGHKNHRVLLRAAALFENCQLVLTGGAGDAETPINDYIAHNRLQSRVKRLGRVSAADLNALMWSARALVFPSLYEGFGLPVVEAMARGVPVIVADATCLPELVGEAGILVSPHDVKGWAEAVNRVAPGTKLATDLSASGMNRAAQFTSESGAEHLAGVYEEVLAE